METEKGKTFKYLREKRGVSEEAKENLKNFNRIKKSILVALEKKRYDCRRAYTGTKYAET